MQIKKCITKIRIVRTAIDVMDAPPPPSSNSKANNANAVKSRKAKGKYFVEK